MLYNGEKVPVWNPIDGEDIGPQIEKRGKDHTDEAIEESRQLKSMTKTLGWQLLSKYIDDQKSICLELLKNSDSLRQVRRLQEAIRAYDSMVAYVHRTIQIGEEFQQQRTPQKEG